MAQHCQKYASHQKKLQIKVVRNRILSKKVHERICLLPPGMELGAQKIGKFEVLFWRETVNYIQFRAHCCQKYASHQKTFKWKLFEIEFCTKKSRSANVYLPLGRSYGPGKIGMFEVLFCRRKNTAKNTHCIKTSLKSFEPHSSTPTVDYALADFLDEIQFRKLLFKAFFDAMHIFGSIEP